MGRWTQALKQSQETSGLTLVARESAILAEIHTVKSPDNTDIIQIATYPDRYTKCAHCGAGMWWTQGDDYRCGKCGMLWSARAVADKTDNSLHAAAVLDLACSYDWQVCLIIGGGINHRAGGLILGEVVGGNEPQWRAFVDRAADAQLHEAIALLIASKASA